MKYEGIVWGKFISRPNRFIADVDISGQTHTVHVKNTGRCRELLTSGADVCLQYCPGGIRKTRYDLISVRKGNRLVNMDSQAPNKVFHEWAEKNIAGLVSIEPEVTFENSRFDFLLRTRKEQIFVEVKGVTLEQDNKARFPDAPTQRGVRHLRELEKAVEQGYKAMVFFAVQMQDVESFSPNEDTHAEFADALRHAHAAGVEVLAYDCLVTPDSLTINKKVNIIL